MTFPLSYSGLVRVYCTTMSGRRLRLNSMPPTQAARMATAKASHGNLSSIPWQNAGSLYCRTSCDGILQSASGLVVQGLFRASISFPPPPPIFYHLSTTILCLQSRLLSMTTYIFHWPIKPIVLLPSLLMHFLQNTAQSQPHSFTPLLAPITSP
jgi:hypothetical protein